MSLSSLLKSVTDFISKHEALHDTHRAAENKKPIVDINTTQENGPIEKKIESQPHNNDTQSEKHVNIEDMSKDKEAAVPVNNSNEPSDEKKESAFTDTSVISENASQSSAIDVNNEVLLEKPVETTPDVFLDVPSLKVQELKINIEDLKARVALNAELAGLIKINVGVDAGIKKLDLDLKGVDLKAVLKVRLKQVYAIFDRALSTIDNNPGILQHQELPQSDKVQQIQNDITNDVNKKVSKGDTPIETHHSLSKDEQRYRFREDED